MPVATPAPLSHNATEAGPSRPPGSRPTMLVVDDEKGPRDSLKVIFEQDFNMLLAENGTQAIELAQTHKIDVAVLDIRMAGLTGIETLERLKYINPAIEAVMMTAFETNDSLRQALRLQACDYINKPFDIATMRDAVMAAMERRTLSNELVKNESELAELQDELQQERLEGEIVKTRGEIYASIIHDLNGPLTVISGQLQIINQEMGDQPRLQGEELDEVKDRLKRITRQVTSCIEISRRYLGFMRPGKSESAQVWINQVLDDLGDLIRIHPCAHNNQFLIHPLREDVLVLINGTDIIQILLNLSLNALQASPTHHRVEIRAQLLQQPLDLSHFHDGPEDRFINRDGFHNTDCLLAITVQDNGPGIPQDVLPRIFDAFYSSHSRDHGSGTGLGLSIVHRLIKGAHGGLHVHSKLGRGTEFTVYLPARPGKGS